MAKFIDAYGSIQSGFPLINLDMVARLKAVPNGNKKIESYDCIDVRGEVVGRVAAYQLSDLDKPTVMPDTTGAIIVEFSWYEDALHQLRFPVLGWTVEGGVASPISVSDHQSSNVLVCVELRTGVWSFQDEASFESLAGAAKYAEDILRPKVTT